jgi:predicted transcriptional regulator
LKIYLDILSTIREEGNCKPTRILYRANLSYDRMVKYLEELMAKGLILEQTEGENRYYIITDNGRGFLIELRKAEEFTRGFGISI